MARKAKYSTEKLAKAVQSIIKGDNTISEAAKEYNIPRSSLRKAYVQTKDHNEDREKEDKENGVEETEVSESVEPVESTDLIDPTEDIEPINFDTDIEDEEVEPIPVKKRRNEHLQRLTPAEETKLVEIIRTLYMTGNAADSSTVKSAAASMLKAKNDSRPLGACWVYNFLKRHPGLSDMIERKAQWFIVPSYYVDPFYDIRPL